MLYKFIVWAYWTKTQFYIGSNPNSVLIYSHILKKKQYLKSFKIKLRTKVNGRNSCQISSCYQNIIHGTFIFGIDNIFFKSHNFVHTKSSIVRITRQIRVCVGKSMLPLFNVPALETSTLIRLS